MLHRNTIWCRNSELVLVLVQTGNSIYHQNNHEDLTVPLETKRFSFSALLFLSNMPICSSTEHQYDESSWYDCEVPWQNQQHPARRFMNLYHGNLHQKGRQDVANSVDALNRHMKKTHRTHVQWRNWNVMLEKRNKFGRRMIIDRAQWENNIFMGIEFPYSIQFEQETEQFCHTWIHINSGGDAI